MSAAPASTVPVAPRAASGSSVIGQAVAELLPATDTLWLEIYHVIAPIDGAGEGRLWRAHRTDTAEEVVLRVVPGEKDLVRVDVWERLAAIELSHLQRAREIHFIAGHRVEVTDAIRGTPLNVWRAARPAVEIAAVEAVMRQLAEALGVLHASGLAHLGLRPETVFVREEAGGLECVLGGLESVVRFEGEQLISATANPLYAPPEAVCLVQHEPGPALCSWDWWSLGRVAQELILGQHVVDKLPDADPSQSAAMRLARAETLLLEHAAKGMRAGAVEVMVGLDPRLDLLLRGLLSSSPDARWGGEFVDRWLRQKPVKEHYTVPRTEQKFRWRGRLHTVSEAAKALRTAEFWAEAGAHIFEPDSASTLAHFISRAPDQALARQQLAELRKLAEGEPLRSLPPAVAREVVQTLALLLLAGANLQWRGRRLDGESLHTLLAENAENPERLAFVRVLTHRAITTHIDRFDFEAGRSLGEVGRLVAEAEATVRRHGWIKEGDEKAAAQIFRLAIEPESALHAACGRLQRDFACSKQPAVDKIFKNPKPTRAELIALAWAEPVAGQCGFVTHGEWEAKQLVTLREGGGQLVGALFWARLGRALAAGPGVFGGWLAVAACWGAIAVLVMIVLPGPKWLAVAFAPVAVALAVRFVFQSVFAKAVQTFAPGARAWKLSDGAARCRSEMHAAGQGRDAASLETALAAINADIAKLTLLRPSPPPLSGPPHFGGTRQVALASWVVLAALAGVGGWRCKVNPPTWSAFRIAWVPSASVPSTAPIGPAGGAASPAVAAAPAATGADAPPSGDVKVSWPYKKGDEAMVLLVQDSMQPTSVQHAYAVKHGRELAAPYRPDTIDTLIIFDVPAGDKIEVVIFDGVKGALASPKAYLLQFRPLARSWVEVAGRKGIYLGE